MEELSLEDWQYYRAMPHWEPLEAACLLKSIHPDSVLDDIPPDIRRVLTIMKRACLTRTLEYKYVELLDTLTVFDYRNKLNYFLDDEQGGYNNFDVHTVIQVFNPLLFLAWASKCGLPIPSQLEIEGEWNGSGYNYGNSPPICFKELQQISKDSHPQNVDEKENLLTIDLEDETIPDELRASLNAWTSLYKGQKDLKEVGGKIGHLNTIAKWVQENCSKEHYPELYKDGAETIANATIERIAKIVNPNKKGGTPKI